MQHILSPADARLLSGDEQGLRRSLAQQNQTFLGLNIEA